MIKKIKKMDNIKLKAILGSIKYNDVTINNIVSTLNTVFNKYDINTPLRQSHFLAQVLHESGAFRYKEELASGDAYDTRTDLGNTPEKDGDGRKYKGYGWIQITGKTNQEAACKALGIPFEKHMLLKEYPYCGLAAGWYWDSRKLNLLADKDDITSITKKVNGGLNGFEDRKHWLIKCKQVLV